MINILFVCHGNICRSPMAEYIFRNMLVQKRIEEHFFVTSAATSATDIGAPIYGLASQKLKEHGIPVTEHSAKLINARDYEKFDYVLVMEKKNILEMQDIIGDILLKKTYCLLDFTDNPRDIADPWFTGDFEVAYKEILEGCQHLLNMLMEKII